MGLLMRVLKEYKIGKERFMQTYNDGPTCTVSFYNGARMDKDLVPFFEDYAVFFECATFYTEVPWSKVNAYLKSVGN
jgi:hypothetical protein